MQAGFKRLESFMIGRTLVTLVLVALVPVLCLAQQAWPHKQTPLDSIFSQWDGITETYTPGMSVMRPQKVRFFATYTAHPQPCSTRLLEAVMTMLGFRDFLKQVKVSHCINLRSAAGRTVTAWVQDSLVAGFVADAKIDGEIEVYADLFAYEVATDRTKNMPTLLVSRFDSN